MSDYIRLEKAQLSRSEPTPEAEAGAKLSRRVLTCCWGSMMTVLTTGLNPPKEQNNKGILNRDGGRRGIRDTVILSLEGLHKAAILSNVLGQYYFLINCLINYSKYLGIHIQMFPIRIAIPVFISSDFHFQLFLFKFIFSLIRSAESLWFHLRSAGESSLYRAVYFENHEDEGCSAPEITKQSN